MPERGESEPVKAELVYTAMRRVGDGMDTAGAQLIDQDALLLECMWSRVSADLQQDPTVNWVAHGRYRRTAFFTYESSVVKYEYTGAAPTATTIPVYMWDALETTINKVVRTGRLDEARGALTVLVNEYYNGAGIGQHYDAESIFGATTDKVSIISTAVGRPAWFVLGDERLGEHTQYLEVAPGQILHMMGQRLRHGILDSNDRATRVSFTIRWTTEYQCPVPAVPDALSRPSFNLCRADVFELLATSRNAALVHQIASQVPHKGPQGIAKVIYRKFPQANVYRPDCVRTVESILPVKIDEQYNLHVVNIVAQLEPGPPKTSKDDFVWRRMWLANALTTTKEWARQQGVNTIIMPQVACGRAGDDWHIMRQILRETCRDQHLRWLVCSLEGPPTKAWVPNRGDMS